MFMRTVARDWIMTPRTIPKNVASMAVKNAVEFLYPSWIMWMVMRAKMSQSIP